MSYKVTSFTRELKKFALLKLNQSENVYLKKSGIQRI